MVYVILSNINFLIYTHKVPPYNTEGLRARSASAVHQPLTGLSGSTKLLLRGVRGILRGTPLSEGTSVDRIQMNSSVFSTEHFRTMK